jgi:pimeloyl-ACP methyl ester carboxylesterase
MLTILGILVLILIMIPYIRSTETYKLTDEVRAGVPGSFVRLSKGWTHYDLSGNKNAKTILLVHGFSVPYFIWESTVKVLTTAGYRVIRYDLWGRGYSDRPDVKYDFTLFESQIQELLDALDIKAPVDIIGISMGGPIVAGFTANHPSKVHKIILIDPFSEKANVFPLNIPLLGGYLTNAIFIPSMPRRNLNDFYRKDKIPAGWTEMFQEQMRYKGFSMAISSTLGNFINKNLRLYFEQLGKQGKPVLIFWGEHDLTTPIESGVYLKEILHPEYHLIPDSGHVPQIENPEAVFPVLLRFLNK